MSIRNWRAQYRLRKINEAVPNITVEVTQPERASLTDTQVADTFRQTLTTHARWLRGIITAPDDGVSSGERRKIAFRELGDLAALVTRPNLTTTIDTQGHAAAMRWSEDGSETRVSAQKVSADRSETETSYGGEVIVDEGAIGVTGTARYIVAAYARASYDVTAHGSPYLEVPDFTLSPIVRAAGASEPVPIYGSEPGKLADALAQLGAR